jgi:PEP-CTERM motif
VIPTDRRARARCIALSNRPYTRDFAGIGISEGYASTNILENAGFESGFLSPWIVARGDPAVSDVESHSGTYSVAADAEAEIEQTFAPIADSEIEEISYWVDIPVSPQRFNQFTFLYSDGTQYTSYSYAYNEGWTLLDITSSLAPDEQLIGFIIAGTSTGDSTTPAYMDDFLIAVRGSSSAAPEPSTWAMMAIGFAGVGYLGYRRGKQPRAA